MREPPQDGDDAIDDPKRRPDRFRPEVSRAVADCRGRLARGEFENGRFYEDRERYRPAAIQYKHVVEGYPDTEWARRAALRLAGGSLRGGDQVLPPPP